MTGGNHHGVMKYVGEAVSMLQTSSKVIAFGIAPWGTVMNKKELTSEHVSASNHLSATCFYKHYDFKVS